MPSISWHLISFRITSPQTFNWVKVATAMQLPITSCTDSCWIEVRVINCTYCKIWNLELYEESTFELYEENNLQKLLFLAGLD